MKVQRAPPEHHAWIVQRAQCAPSPGFYALEAVDDEGRIHGMVAYDLATPTMVQMHIAFDNVAALRSLLVPGFEEAFTGPRKLILAAIPDNNSESRFLVEHLGFQDVYHIREGWNEGVDLVLYEMRRTDCKWLRKAA